MKLLGVDFGSRRIGLAIGDSETSLALPLRSVAASGGAAAVAAAALEEGAERIVVGVPYPLRGGRPGVMQQAVLAFVDVLRENTAFEVDTEDERLTTALVERLRRDAGVKKERFDRDAAAATAILESYIGRKFRSD